MEKTTFFTKDKSFYKALFTMLIWVAFQNIVAYSVNMIDNVMLGRYSQDALSGAATVNQVFFMVQQFALAIGNSLVVIASQYWGEKKTEPIVKLTGIALRLGIITGIVIIAVCTVAPEAVLRIFTNEPAILAQGMQYLNIIKWTFILFVISQILMCALRSIGTVRISFLISVVSLIVNACINYILIFGKFGFPEMGIRGAAIGTLIARAVELVIVVVYIIARETKIKLFTSSLFHVDKVLRKDYTKVYLPIMCSQVLWGVSVPMQTAILGHISDIAIVANSIATTFYQYLKVIVIAMSSTSAVMIGNAIGRGDMKRIKSDARTLAVIDVLIGLVLGIILIALRNPLLAFYSEVTPDVALLAKHLIVVMGFVMVGMSYQMPVSFGIIQGAGDAKFTMKMNMISTWCIVMPLSLMAAFWWKWPVVLVVIVIQSDQIFKGLPTFIRFRGYKWIRKLTRPESGE